MRKETLQSAIKEAVGFEMKARRALYRFEKEPKFWEGPSKETGAALRASMDLTRVLADLRQGR